MFTKRNNVQSYERTSMERINIIPFFLTIRNYTCHPSNTKLHPEMKIKKNQSSVNQPGMTGSRGTS